MPVMTSIAAAVPRAAGKTVSSEKSASARVIVSSAGNRMK